MGTRFEAWTLPWSSSGFQRVIADIPVSSGRGAVRFNDFGESRITIPDDYDRLDEIISDTTGTLIRVYQGSSVINEFLARRVERNIDETGNANISGPGLESMFDHTIVYPFDYPTNEFLDHVWGGVNVLQNPDFNSSQAVPTLYELIITATGGTFTLTDGTDTTSAIAYNASDSTIETRLETDISAIDDVLVTAIDGGFQIEFVTPAFGVTLSVNTGSLTGGTATLTQTQTGSLQPSGWTKAQQISFGSPQVFGEYDTFALTSSVADTGSTHSLEINPATIGRRYAGAQQVVTVKPGGTYQGLVRIRTTNASNEYRLVVRSVDGDLIKTSSETSFSTGSFQDFALSDIQIPAGVTQVIFRISNVDASGNPATFYIGKGELNEGQAEANVGTIVAALMDDATSDHSGDTRGTLLTWVDYSGFDTTNDSTTTAWDDVLSFTAYRGMTYGQVFDRLVSLGYEWRLTPKTNSDSYAAGADTHNLDWYNPDDAGTDYTTADTPSIHAGTNVEGGPVVKRIPDYTAILVEGDGVIVEDTDATALTNFGRFERYHGDQAIASTTSATAAADALFSLESTNRTGVKVTVTATDDHPTPLVDYTVGDTLYFSLPPALAKQSRRVKQIDWQYDDDTTTFDVTGSRVFVGDTGGWEALRLLIRRFQKRTDRPAPTSAGGVGGGGGMAHILIVSTSEPLAIQAKADYVIPETNSSTELQAAFDAVPSKWSVWMAGTFNLDSDVTTPSGSWVRGLGYTAAGGSS